ncbi:MAG TPA: hypothetical protein VNJ71_00255 [Gemmatimonadales bacterium]|jgi:hypothetical protein|nr:hypothetical protein [Gemmatimonadales bacterium]
MKRLVTAVLVLGLTGCEAQLKETGISITNVLTRVTDASGSVQAVLHQGFPPGPNGGPSHTVNGFGAMVNGGSSQTTLTSTGGNFDRVIVTVPGTDDYYELAVPSGTGTQVLLQASTGLSSGTWAIQYAVGTAGVIGSYSTQRLRVIGVGTGDVQISVAWSDTSDVDLHVWDPSGEEIFYADTASTSGGFLDLDSNAACSRDANNEFNSNENIVWPTGRAPSGTYVVKLHHWSRCNIAQNTDWVVTVQARGQSPRIFSGSFAASDTTPWRDITTFSY